MENLQISIWSAALILFVVALWYSRRPRRPKTKTQSDLPHPMNLRVYRFLRRFRYSRSLLFRYQYSLKQLTRLREGALLEKTGDFFRKLMLAFLILLSGLLFLTRNLVYLGMYVFVILVLIEVFVDYVLVKRHNQLLQGQILFDELVRQKYYEQGTVEEAVYEACQEFPDKTSPMLIQGEYLYDVLMESDVEEAVRRYNQQAPNKYLKMLLNLCYITAEYGDSQMNGQSVFMGSLSHLTDELRVEELKRERLNYSLKSLHFIAVLPLLCMLPLQNWASRNFEPLRLFYQSRFGRITELVMFCLILSVVMMLRKIQNIGIISEERVERRRETEIPIRKRRIRFISFGVGLLLIFFINWQEHNRIRQTSVLENTMFFGGGEEYRQVLREKEAEWLDGLNPRLKKPAVLAVLRAKAEKLPELSGLQGKGLDRYVNQLYEKYRQLHRPWLELWQVAVLAALSFALGYWYLLADALAGRVREMEREDEVAAYRSILLMLMHHTRLGMEDILTWLNMFAHYYEERFERCLNNFSMGAEEAFAELKVEKQADFQTLVLQLEAAAKDLSLQQAFDDLVHEKAYYLERRKEINRQMIAKRLAMGEMIGFLPAYGLIALYLIIPMIYSGMESLNQFYQQL